MKSRTQTLPKFPYRSDSGLMMLGNGNRYDATNQINASVIFMIPGSREERDLYRDFQRDFTEKSAGVWSKLQKQTPAISSGVDYMANRGNDSYPIRYWNWNIDAVPLLTLIGEPTFEYSMLEQCLRILDNSSPTYKFYHNEHEHEWQFEIPWNTSRVAGNPHSDMGFLDDTFYNNARSVFLAEDETEHLCIIQKSDVDLRSIFHNATIRVIVFRQFATIVEGEVSKWR